MRTALIALSVSLLGLQTAQAQLEWTNTAVEIHPALDESESSGEFTFKNTGEQPVIIKEIKPSCGCTTTALDKATIGPGEEGKITAHFDHGKRQGFQEKSIEVTTDQAEQPTTLTMKIYLPEILEIKPLFVWWEKGEERTPKDFTVKVVSDEQIHILKTSAGDVRLQTEIKEVEEGRLYTITVTPTTTDDALRTLINIETDFPIENRKSFRAFSHIR